MFAVRRLLYFGATLMFLFLFSLPLLAAEPSQELAARSLLGEAEKLIECALPQEAVPILDRVKAEYPATEAAVYAGLRKAQCFFFLKQYDSAISTAQNVISSNPGIMAACWAQCTLGQSLVDSGRTAAGIVELKKVEAMLPDSKDLGPMNEARETLGRICLNFLADRTEDLDAVGFLGMDRTDVKARAKVLAILAAYRARKGQLNRAKSTLVRLETECASETAEIGWANAEVALFESQIDLRPETAVVLSSLASSSQTGDYQSARASITLAKLKNRNGETAAAVDILRGAVEKHSSATQFSEMPQMLYDLGNTLLRQGQTAEGLAALWRIPSEFPMSGYSAPALYCIGSRSDAGREAAVQALTMLAEGGYEPKWRAIAWWRLASIYRPDDKIKARECYDRSLQTFRQCLAEQKADIGVDWKRMLENRISVIEAEIADMDAQGVAR